MSMGYKIENVQTINTGCTTITFTSYSDLGDWMGDTCGLGFTLGAFILLIRLILISIGILV
jgi:hypothetical protein